MKKMILLFCIALFCVSCDPPQNAWTWGVKNCTEQTLILKFPEYSIRDNGTLVYRTVTLQQGYTATLYSSHTSEHRIINFSYFFDTIVNRYGEDVYWQILSEDKVVLKTWNYSERHLSDRNFFEKSLWQYAQGPGGYGFVVADYSWTFEIQQEDISSN